LQSWTFARAAVVVGCIGAGSLGSSGGSDTGAVDW